MKISRKSWHCKLAEFAGFFEENKNQSLFIYIFYVLLGTCPFIFDLAFFAGIFNVLFFDTDYKPVVIFLLAVYALFFSMFSYLQNTYAGPCCAWPIFMKSSAKKINIEFID